MFRSDRKWHVLDIVKLEDIIDLLVLFFIKVANGFLTYEFNKDSSYQFEIKFENGDALSFSLVNEKDIGDVSNWLKDIVHTGTQLKKKINYQISRPIVKSTPLEN